jgi:5S rRNA maturation endonuclease (ribonuclease M5)
LAYSYSQIRAKANKVRNILLVDILRRNNAVQDKYDKHKWHTYKGVISVNGQKFMNWNQDFGGGGAIDLVIHLLDLDFKTAVIWLAENFASGSDPKINPYKKIILRLPPKNNSYLPRLIDYLHCRRFIPLSLINQLIDSGKIYADNKANVVFLLLGKEKKIVGAELRGTSQQKWVGMAEGSRKDLGAFYITSNSKYVVICESAIDAISCFIIHPDCIAISTAGATPNPAWLSHLVKRNMKIFCGFDADETGDRAAKIMLRQYPQIKRLRPDKHDWNEELKSIK